MTLSSGLSNLPPGGGFYRGPEPARQGCKNGHTWEAYMFFELGGDFYCDEDQGPICPLCGEEDIITDLKVQGAIGRFCKAIAG